MKKKYLIASTILCFALSGCFGTVPTQSETKVVTVTIKPSTDLVKDCSLASAPPNPAEYKIASFEQREIMLHDFAVGALTAFNLCNERWATLRDWIAKQDKNLAEPASAASKP